MIGFRLLEVKEEERGARYCLYEGVMCELDDEDTDASCATHQLNQYIPSNRHIAYRRPRCSASSQEKEDE
jgi:hypothetical protein